MEVVFAPSSHKLQNPLIPSFMLFPHLPAKWRGLSRWREEQSHNMEGTWVTKLLFRADILKNAVQPGTHMLDF